MRGDLYYAFYQVVSLMIIFIETVRICLCMIFTLCLGREKKVLGAICGDILGSTYEIEIKEDIYLLHKEDHFTDDTVLTCAIAAATKMALDGNGKEQIKKYIQDKYFYDLSKSLEEIKMKDDEFSATCQVTVPQAIIAFLEGDDYEDTVFKAISIGGDCDTVAAMAGSIAYAYWKKIPEHIIEHCTGIMSSEMKQLVKDFEKKYNKSGEI